MSAQNMAAAPAGGLTKTQALNIGLAAAGTAAAGYGAYRAYRHYRPKKRSSRSRYF